MSVTNREIYTGALSLIGEVANSVNIEDYEERVPYLIASFCSSNSSLDKRIRKSEKLPEAHKFSPVYLPLELEFPLCEKLTSAAELYTASMLTIDEDSELSDSLYDKYCDAIASIGSTYEALEKQSIPTASCESIKENYFFD